MIALFDLDGVIVDTETQYGEFWKVKGLEYFGIDNFGSVIRGQTLNQVAEKYFPLIGNSDQLVRELADFEENMSYEYIPGADVFLKELKAFSVPVAIVTSSNQLKMEKVRKSRPELWDIADAIITSEWFSRSKPDPECFIRGMKYFDAKPEDTFVFEDSFHGLNAGRASGAKVIGLSTSKSREDIAELCDAVIDNFLNINLETLKCIYNETF